MTTTKKPRKRRETPERRELLASIEREAQRGCLCPRAKCRYPDVCVTVDRWASAIRAAHWHEDDVLEAWETFQLRRDGSEAETWRLVARVAIGALRSL